MKTLVAALGMIAISSAAFAQGAQPLSGPPASGGASQQQAPAAGTAASQSRTVAQCRDDARNQRLRGDERKNFMRDCARDIKASCRDQARAQRLDRDARRDFMASCTRPAVTQCATPGNGRSAASRRHAGARAAIAASGYNEQWSRAHRCPALRSGGDSGLLSQARNGCERDQSRRRGLASAPEPWCRESR